MKVKRDGYLLLMPDGEFIFQTMDHAERSGMEIGFSRRWRVHNDDEYLMAIDAADMLLERLAK